MNDQYFVGKYCTILTIPVNRDFRAENPDSYPEQVFAYFCGFVEQIDERGVVLRQLKGNLKTMIYKSAVVGIAEEVSFDPENAADAQAIDEFKKHTTKITEPAKTMDVESMNQTAKILKQTYGNKK